jgi:pyruvate dehydrogenase E1 component alpha subunit
MDEGVLTEDEFAEIQADIEQEIEDAVEFARESPFPDPSAAYEGLYSNQSEQA